MVWVETDEDSNDYQTRREGKGSCIDMIPDS